MHLSVALGGTNTFNLPYAPAPADNPLKGFFPFAGSYTNFPHSMEYAYLPLRALMTGPTNFNWSRIEEALNDIARRGHQAIIRVYLDYPTHPPGLPQYLLDAGLRTHAYDDYGNKGRSLSPDYQNPLLRQALANFIAAWGKRYDGDARLGFITVGILGFWGEWHTYPHTDWAPSEAVQNEVLDAFERGFTKTKFLVRQPYGNNPQGRPMGYHDDSFAFQTIDPPDWHFLGTLKAAGATNQWRSQPIGGEVRPDLQPCMWRLDARNCVPVGQTFEQCVKQTHASWMINQFAFIPGFNGGDKQRAIEGARLLGYELSVTTAEIADTVPGSPLSVRLRLRNFGVAPFYYDWPVILYAVGANPRVNQSWAPVWNLSTILPGSSDTLWISVTPHNLNPGRYRLLLGVQNPLLHGKVLRFANTAQDADLADWLTLGHFQVLPQASNP